MRGGGGGGGGGVIVSLCNFLNFFLFKILENALLIHVCDLLSHIPRV